MSDVIYVTVTLAFFAATWGLARLIEKL